jgi:hypothetical protein
MATFRVYYFGLIAHVSNSGSHDIKDHASIVRTIPGPHHPHHPVFVADGVFRAIDSQVYEIYVGTPAQVIVEQSFRDWVPSLERLMGGRIASDAKEKSIEVFYPGPDARLSAAQLYPTQAHYENGSSQIPDQCVARATVVTLNNAPEEVTIRAIRKNGHEVWAETIVVDTDRCVFIGNIPEQSAPAAHPIEILANASFSHPKANDHQSSTPHHHDAATPRVAPTHLHGHTHTQIYGELLDADNAATLTVGETSVHCEIPFVGCPWVKTLLDGLRLHLADGDTVECGNTQWP